MDVVDKFDFYVRKIAELRQELIRAAETRAAEIASCNARIEKAENALEAMTELLRLAEERHRAEMCEHAKAIEGGLAVDDTGRILFEVGGVGRSLSLEFSVAFAEKILDRAATAAK